MASNCFLDNLNQNEADEISIDYSKVDLVRQEQDLIYRLFHVSINFGDKVKPTKESTILQMTQWLTIIGNSKENRDEAKVSGSF
jgi:hypothetical protein